jgi:hypothetical protein
MSWHVDFTYGDGDPWYVCHMSLKNEQVGVQKVLNLGDTCPHTTPLPHGIRHHQSNKWSTFLLSRYDDLCGFGTMALHSMASTLQGFDTSRFFLVSSNCPSGEVSKSQNFAILPLQIYESHYSLTSYQIGWSTRLRDFDLFHASTLSPKIFKATKFQSFPSLPWLLSTTNNRPV